MQRWSQIEDRLDRSGPHLIFSGTSGSGSGSGTGPDGPYLLQSTLLTYTWCVVSVDRANQTSDQGVVATQPMIDSTKDDMILLCLAETDSIKYG